MSIKELALRCLQADGSAFFAAAALDPQAAVPGCPGWDVDKLVGHVGRVHTWAAQVVRSRTAEPISSRLFPEGPENAPELRLDWGRERHAELLDALRGLDEEEPIWVFLPRSGTGRGGFWLRRQAQELMLHRWDAQQATGDPQPLDAALAADGIDELLTQFLAPAASHTTKVAGGGETMHLHCTDREGEWLVRFTEGGLQVTREHAKGDVAVRGPAETLHLLLWNRISRDGLDVFGDASLLDRWREHIHV